MSGFMKSRNGSWFRVGAVLSVDRTAAGQSGVTIFGGGRFFVDMPADELVKEILKLEDEYIEADGVQE